jgi:N-dimethylarginine dimethylaminohydrolase
VFQIVDKDLALIRRKFATDDVIRCLESYGFHLIKIAETEEITKNQAMNIVTIAPRKIVMVANNPLTKRIYEKNGIEIAAEVEVSELIKGAGGLGCATGILCRM